MTTATFDTVAEAIAAPAITEDFVTTQGTPDGGELGRLYAREAVEPEQVFKFQSADGAWFGRVVDSNRGGMIDAARLNCPPGLSDCTARTQAIADRNDLEAPVVFGAGERLIDSVVASSPIDWKFPRGSVLRQRSASVSTDVMGMLSVVSGAEGSRIENITLDGDRATHQSSYIETDYFQGWTGLSIEAPDVNLIGFNAKNFIDWPLLGRGDRFFARRLRIKDSGHGACFGVSPLEGVIAGAEAKNQDISGGIMLHIDNLGAPIYQHVFNTYQATDGSYRNLAIIEPGGDTSGNSGSLSAFTFSNDRGCSYKGLRVINPLSETLFHVVISFVSCIDGNVEDAQGWNYAGMGMEFAGCSGMIGSDCLMDGKYRATSVLVVDGSGAMVWHGGGHSSDGQWVSNAGSQQGVFTNMLFRRLGYGEHIRSGRLTMVNRINQGHTKRGAWISNEQPAFSFLNPYEKPQTSVRYIGGSSTHCGENGLFIDGACKVHVDGGDYSNNNQTQQTGQSRSANITAEGAAGAELTIINANVGDTQATILQVAGCSFEPGATDANNRKVIRLLSADRWAMGQHILLKHATGADINGKIVDFDLSQDLATVEFSAPQTFVSTGNTTALSGTWSGSDTALTGSGGAASTQIKGAVWITDGVEWRYTINVPSANAMTINAPFTTALSGAALSMLLIDVAGVTSALAGVYAVNGVAKLMLKNLDYGGVNKKILGGVALTAHQRGSEYWMTDTQSVVGVTGKTMGVALPKGHRGSLGGNVNVAITGATSFSMEFRALSGATLQVIQTGIGLTKNTKFGGSFDGASAPVDSNLVRAIFNTPPTAGQISVEALIKVDRVPDLADVP